MHTAICAFEDRARAEQAVEGLVRAGFARHDVHIEHKRLPAEGSAEDQWGGTEGDRGLLSSFGHFFASLLGRDNPSGQADTYSGHVERGGFVVVVDADDDTQAQRARSLLQDMGAGDLDVVQRGGQRPLRDIVARPEAPAGMPERSREAYEGAATGSAIERERAMASARRDAGTGAAPRDPDLEHAPGLRYADQDKPN